MTEPRTIITRGKEVLAHIRQGWELWHVSHDALPGRWELRRGREQMPVHWDAVVTLQRHYLAELDELVEEHQEGRYTWAYVPKQRSLVGGAL